MALSACFALASQWFRRTFKVSHTAQPAVARGPRRRPLSFTLLHADSLPIRFTVAKRGLRLDLLPARVRFTDWPRSKPPPCALRPRSDAVRGARRYALTVTQLLVQMAVRFELLRSGLLSWGFLARGVHGSPPTLPSELRSRRLHIRSTEHPPHEGVHVPWCFQRRALSSRACPTEVVHAARPLPPGASSARPLESCSDPCTRHGGSGLRAMLAKAPRLVPPSGCLNRVADCSARGVRACCIPLPVLSFVAFGTKGRSWTPLRASSPRRLRHPRPAVRRPRPECLRLPRDAGPFEVFPSPTAPVRHPGSVSLRRSADRVHRVHHMGVPSCRYRTGGRLRWGRQP